MFKSVWLAPGIASEYWSISKMFKREPNWLHIVVLLLFELKCRSSRDWQFRKAQIDGVLIMVYGVGLCSVLSFCFVPVSALVIVGMGMTVRMRVTMITFDIAIDMDMRSARVLYLLIDRRASMRMGNIRTLCDE